MRKALFALILTILTHGDLDAQWVRLSSQLTGPIVTVGNILLLSDEAMFRSTDSGNIWEPVNGMPSPVCEWRYLLTHNSDAYLTTDYCGFFYSSDSGQSWGNYSNGLDYTFFAQPVAVGDMLFMNKQDDGLWESDDKVANWHSIKDQEPNCHFGYDTTAYCWALDSNYLFVGATPFGGVYRSPDTAVTWDRVLPFPFDTGIFAITAHGRFVIAAARVSIGQHNVGLYRSTDWGTSWNIEENNLSSHFIGVLTAFNNIMFAGGDFGVYFSSDNGENWVDANADTAMGTITSFTTLGPYVYASGGGSTWRRPLSDFDNSAVNNSSPPANTISLDNYPDPATSRTMLSFTLPEAGSVGLTLTDAAGRETPFLHFAWLDAGQHEVIWDASKYPSGVYLCRLVSDGQSIARRVVVIH